MPLPLSPTTRRARATRAVLAAALAVLAGALGTSTAQAADPPPTLTISGLSGHYHSDGPISLAVVQSPDTGNAHYHWYHQCGTATDWTVVPGASATLNLTAAPALHGCKVVVRLFGEAHAVVAESAPAVIDVDDHGQGPALPTVTVDGLRAHYHAGDAVELTAAIDPAPAETNATYRWYQQCGAETAWTPVADAPVGEPLSAVAAPELDGCRIVARHYGVASDPVTVHVEDHGAVTTTLSTTGLRDHYHPGDPITLQARQDPATELDHYHWFVQCGTGDWTIEPSNATATWTAVAELRHEGCRVQAKLYDDDHEVVAESSPVTLRVRDHVPAPAPPAETPTPGLPTPAPDPGAVAPAPATVPPATTATLTPSAVRKVATLRRQKALRATVRLNGAGRVSVRATITAAAARRLGLRVAKGARTVSLGTGTATKSRPGSAVVRIALSAKHRRALGTLRGSLRITLAATVRSADGSTLRRTRTTTVRR